MRPLKTKVNLGELTDTQPWNRYISMRGRGRSPAQLGAHKFHFFLVKNTNVFCLQSMGRLKIMRRADSLQEQIEGGQI